MIGLDNLLNMICTEAFEHSGIPEVPDHKHGAPQNYSALKREAREVFRGEQRFNATNLPALRYDLELVEEADGTLHWIE